MPKYEKLKHLWISQSVIKSERTTSIALDGRRAYGGIGNEAIDVGLWVEEKISDGTISISNPDLSALIALTGVSAGSSNLGTFTGSTISDNTTIKNALQQLETLFESSVAYTDEQAQDAVGNILNDTSTIHFVYSDATPSIAAQVIDNSITFAKMQTISANKLLGRYTAGTGNVEQISISSNLTLSGGTLDINFTPATGTVTSVGLSLPGIFTVTNSPVTSTGTLTGSLATQVANTIFAGPTTGSDAAPTFRALVANDIPTLTSSKISDFNESVDDRVAALLVAGTNITLTYNDGANTLTIDASGTSYTDEDAQDAIGGIIIDSDTINFTYNDGTPSITGDVITQMSVTSNASGLKLVGDASSPGNSKYYGTDSGGTKGFFTIPSSSLPSGTSSQTLRFNASNTLVASSTILNDGTYVGIGGSPVSGYKLFIGGGTRSAGVFYARGTGSFGSDVTNAEVRIENTDPSTGQTWYLHSADTGELLIATNPVGPEITIDTNNDVIIGYQLSIGDTSSTPDTLIGVDSSGYVGGITLGTGLMLSSGVLSAPTGSLPTPTDAGQIVYWDGADWQVAIATKNIQTPTPGTTDVNLPSVPISDLPTDVYLNGVLKEDGVDYTLSGNTITFAYVFITNDKVTTKYFE